LNVKSAKIFYEFDTRLLKNYRRRFFLKTENHSKMMRFAGSLRSLLSEAAGMELSTEKDTNERGGKLNNHAFYFCDSFRTSL
jgi:hypothetical protein